jgi:putative transposase
VIEWLTDNGSGYIAGETRRFAREIGLELWKTPVQSPQTNGMAEAFVRAMKPGSMRCRTPESSCVSCQHVRSSQPALPAQGAGYRSLREFIADGLTKEGVSGL